MLPVQYNSNVIARRIKLVLVISLLALTPVSFVRIAQLTLRTKGSWDFYQYWVSGTRLVQGERFYVLEPSPPSAEELSANDELTALGARFGYLLNAPSTPLFVFVIAPYSIFAWGQAKLLWFITNFLVILITPLLILKLPVFKELELKRIDKALVALGFYNLLVTKLAIEAGQVVLIIMALMIASLVLAPGIKSGAGYFWDLPYPNTRLRHRLCSSF